MNRQEFIDDLRAALNGNVSPALVQDHINYYNEYISGEVRKGRAEEEILDALGDPRLIARTIIETNTAENDGGRAYQSAGYRQDQGYGEYRQAQYQGENSYGQDGYSQNGYGQNSYGQGGFKQSGYQQGGYNGGYYQQGGNRQYRIPGWVWLVVFVLVIIAVISIIFSVLSFLAPIIIPLFVVAFFVKLFRDWLH